MLRALLAFLLLSSIAVGQDVVMYGSGDVVGYRFVLKTTNGKEVASPAPIHVEWLSSAEMAGRVCNTFRGKCLFLNNLVKVEELASSRMACPDQELAQLENKIFTYLRSGMSFVVFGDTLEMRRDDIVLLFDKVGRAGEEVPAVPAVKPEAKPVEEKAPAAEPEKGEGGNEDAGDDNHVAEKDLIGRKFVLTTVDGETFASDMGKQPFIQFGEEFRVNGSACNSFTGPGELKDGTLWLRNAAATMMMCVDPKLSGYERDFHAMMREGAAVELTGDILILEGGGKTYLFTEEK